MIDILIIKKLINEKERKKRKRKTKTKENHSQVFYIFKSCVHRTLIGKMLRCL